MKNFHPVVLNEYDPEWSSLFLQEQAILASILHFGKASIHHIGSTAIPGVPSKPIIDMLIGVEVLETAKEDYRDNLYDAGYLLLRKDKVPNRVFYEKKDLETGKIKYHLHFGLINHPYYRHKLIFRDYLRKNQLARTEYMDLKRDLAYKHGDNRSAYTEAKGPFVSRIVDKALKDKT